MSERDSSLAEIQEHRAKIDEIDKQIVALLNKRAGHSLVIRGLKPGAHLGLYDAKREEAVIGEESIVAAMSFVKAGFRGEKRQLLSETYLKST